MINNTTKQICNDDIYLDKLKKLQELTDCETSHQKADDIIMELLSELGYNDIVDAYKSIEKWYS